MSLVDIVRNAMLAGFGVQEKVREMIDDLVKKGELSESQGARLVKEWSEKVEKNTEDISKNINEVVSKAIERMNFATRSDIKDLSDKIEALAGRVKKLEGDESEGGSQ